MPDTGAKQAFDIRSEAHGPHWVAWVADAAGKPRDAVVLVGQTRQEAEHRARAWAEAMLDRGNL